MQYNWKLSNWPKFVFSISGLEEKLYKFAQETGEVNILLKTLPADLKQETLVEIILSEAIKTSAIEGEFLSRADVISSIKNNLGINKTTEIIKDRRASGIADLMIEVRNKFDQDLDKQTLYYWHKLLFSKSSNINVGAWRSGAEPMRVVSGSLDKEIVHFEAPPSSTVDTEMKVFFDWFKDTKPGGSKTIKDPLIRSGIAHLYFESIHPFEDGNGRIGRAIAEKALSQTLGRPVMLSLSKVIERNKKDYYNALKIAQRSNDISDWLGYFVDVALNAQMEVKQMIDFTLKKIQTFDLFKDKLNERQQKVLQKMYSCGLDGFEGGMTAKKYQAITRASKATSTRDLQELEKLGILIVAGGGRSTNYHLNH